MVQRRWHDSGILSLLHPSKGHKNILAFFLAVAQGPQSHHQCPTPIPPSPPELLSTSLCPGSCSGNNATAQGLPSSLVTGSHPWLSLRQLFWFIFPSVKYFCHEHQCNINNISISIQFCVVVNAFLWQVFVFVITVMKYIYWLQQLQDF